MSTPIHEKEQHSFPAFSPSHPSQSQGRRRSSDEDGTLNNDLDEHKLHATTSYADGPDHLNRLPQENYQSASVHRDDENQRLGDDLLMLEVEQVVNRVESEIDDTHIGRNKSLARSRSRHAGSEPADDFDIGTTPIHEQTKIYKPPANPTTKLAKFFKKVHQSSFLVRYFCYIAPFSLLLLIPVLFGLLLFKDANVAGVKLFWFGIWLEIVWLTLWAARVRFTHPTFEQKLTFLRS